MLKWIRKLLMELIAELFAIRFINAKALFFYWRAKVFQFAVRAIRLAGGAAAAAVEDEPVAQVGPTLAREVFHQVLLDAHGVFEFRKDEALGQAADMGVHHDASVFWKRISENDIRALVGALRAEHRGDEEFQRM